METNVNYVLWKEFLFLKKLDYKIYRIFKNPFILKFRIMKNLVLVALLLITATTFAQRKRYKNITEKNGNIGIGTKTPDALLTVKGQIHTQEVQVDLKGAVAPDYVFESYFKGSSLLLPSYQFPTLGEVALFVEENHHLPGVPSAKEFKEEGIWLKEMNLLLLQKIEELTLYTLEQQEQINDLNKKMKSLNKETTN